MMLNNQTQVTEFILQGFSDSVPLRILLFSNFFFLYTAAFTGNILIMVLVIWSSILHTPMYFFLVNLSMLDIMCTTSVLPKVLENLVSEKKTISYGGCMAQVYFLTWSVSGELLLFTAMAYDRYAAICHPLHYSTMMSKRICFLLAVGVWSICGLNTTIKTELMIRLSFCGPNIIDQFFCEMPAALLLSCTSTHVNDIMTVLADVFFSVLNFLLTIVCYCFIISSIMRIRTREGKKRAFCTCSSHLIVVTMYYCIVFYAYVNPISSCSPESAKFVAVLYTAVSPTLNPLIYTLRNKDVREALKKVPLFNK
ncbi:LOW QUALITY PROTEIN: olfactory receptor 13A1-like [Trichosurus vulpecula]|uniref:LOW QUALITY PROTEIN: olfactory receptor 13A1-like n=1 Tax=Trichosurus vulpecula TaxID=9337 RepID=UPI00186B58A2|nr:LOW QUALITY PROTEIN: olfactory receptor 13A1-like [Trichosurus vulpecula]